MAVAFILTQLSLTTTMADPESLMQLEKSCIWESLNPLIMLPRSPTETMINDQQTKWATAKKFRPKTQDRRKEIIEKVQIIMKASQSSIKELNFTKIRKEKNLQCHIAQENPFSNKKIKKLKIILTKEKINKMNWLMKTKTRKKKNKNKKGKKVEKEINSCLNF